MNRIRTESSLPERHDRLAQEAIGVDRFCSSSLWTLPALEAFRPETDELVLGGDDSASVAFVASDSSQVGRFLAPLESTWGLASPVVARTVEDAGRAVSELVRQREERLAVLLGIQHALAREVCRGLTRGTRVQLLDRTIRHIASLDGGLDGYLGRRTRKFRASLRRSARLAEREGIRFERHSLESARAVDAHYASVLKIESTSWKSLEGNGAAQGPMVEFTRGVLQRAATVDRALLILAHRGEERVGYIHGAFVNNGFRGLQMSFDHRFPTLSLGNLLQREMIGWLCELGASKYDLGSELPYKRRWAEHAFETTGLAIIR